MNEDVGNTLRSIAEIIRGLGTGGLACLLWTAVFCVAIFKLDSATLINYWPYLYWTWIGTAGLSLVARIVIAKFVDTASTSGPQLAEEEKSPAPPTPQGPRAEFSGTAIGCTAGNNSFESATTQCGFERLTGGEHESQT